MFYANHFAAKIGLLSNYTFYQKPNLAATDLKEVSESCLSFTVWENVARDF